MSRVPAGLRPALLRWYRRHRRELPWRSTRDPYAVWVSEVMLQQTQVATVLPYYGRFMASYPDVAALAGADEEQVLAAWSGLGYYRRARALHAGAIAVMERHGGRVPDDPRALRALPGIGRYTAGAIASIAFGRAEPVLDGNVRRVLSRLLTEGRDARLWETAAEIARGADPGSLNQALMELGALVCTPRAPDCPSCPLSRFCSARANGRVEAWPPARPRGPTVSVDVAVALVRRSGRVLLERPGDDNPFRGRWDLPAVELNGTDAEPAIARALRRRGLHVMTGAPVATARHGILRRRLRLLVVPCVLARGRVAGCETLRWVGVDELDRVAVSGATRKVLRECPRPPAERRPRRRPTARRG